MRFTILESRHLSASPELMFQQLYNLLQWEKGDAGEVAARGLQEFLGRGRTFLHQFREPDKEEAYLAMILSYSGKTTSPITCGTSPDGSLIMATNRSGNLILWDSKTGRQAASMSGVSRPCAFSPDGKTIISAGSDKSLKIIDLAAKKEIAALKGHEGHISCCSFSPDGKTIVSSDFDGKILVWEAKSGKKVATLESDEKSREGRPARHLWSGSGDYVRADLLARTTSHYLAQVGGVRGEGKDVNHFAFSPDGKRIVAAEGGLEHKPSNLQVWDLESKKLIRTLRGHEDRVGSCAYSPDGNKIVSTDFNETIRIWNAETGTEIEKFRSGPFPDSLSFSPDGKGILYGCQDGTLRIWDTEAHKVAFNVKGHPGRITSCGYFPDGKRIVSAGEDGTVRIWDAEKGYESFHLRVDSEPVTEFSFSPDNKHAVSRGRSLIHWDLESGKRAGLFRSDPLLLHGCAFSPNGDCLVSSYCERDIFFCIWDAKTRESKAAVQSRYTAYSYAYSPDGSRIISGQKHDFLKNDLLIWDSMRAENISALPGHRDTVVSCAYSPEGRRIISVSDDKTMKIWDSASFQALKTIDIPERYTGYDDYDVRESRKRKACDFSPDGKRIICSNKYSLGYGWRYRMLLLDTDGNQITEVPTEYPVQCAFSPDGRRIVAVSYRALEPLQVMRSRTIKAEWETKHFLGLVSDFGFSPDGKRIMAACGDGNLFIWDADSGERLGRYYVEGRAIACAFSCDGGSLAVSDSMGNVHFLKLEGTKPGIPIVTPVRQWLFNKNQGSGGWDDNFVARCRWCGGSFATMERILDIIRGISGDAGFTVEQSPVFELPDEAWDEPRLISECPHCRRRLKFNPFAVDKRDLF